MKNPPPLQIENIPNLPPIDVSYGATIMAGAPTLVGIAQQDRNTSGQYHTPLRCIGVRLADGSVATNGTDIYRHRRTFPCELDMLDTPVERLEGSGIFAGVMGPQFGHVISQSIGRLWVTEACNPSVPLLFLNANPGFTEIPGYFRELMNSIGIRNPIQLLTKPTLVPQLVIGADLCNLDRRPAATPEYLFWLRRRRPISEVDPNLSIYVSRSALGLEKAQYLYEKALETALSKEGYQIVHPEALPLRDQIHIYQRASRLIFADGSAVHLWSLFSDSSQNVAIILRRPLSPVFRNWFKSFGTTRLQMLDFVVGNFWRRGMGGNRTVAVVDMAGLWARLGASGFHSGRLAPVIQSDQLLYWLDKIESGGNSIALAPEPLDPRSRDLLRSRNRFTRRTSTSIG